MHGIEGRAWCYDRCMYTVIATIDDLHMQFDIVIIISTENKTCTVQSQLGIQQYGSLPYCVLSLSALQYIAVLQYMIKFHKRTHYVFKTCF